MHLQQYLLEVGEAVEDVGLDVDELVDAVALVGFDHLFGEACEDEALHLALEHLAHRLGELGILVVARTEHHHVGTALEGGLGTLFGSGEARVVDNLIAGHTEEVGGEARAGLAHGEVAVGQQEHLGAVACLLGLQAQLLEGFGTAVGLEHANLVALLAAAATAVAVVLNLLAHLFQQVGVLVGAEDGGLAGGDVEVALVSGGFHLVLHHAGTEGLAETAGLLHLQEVLPGTLGDVVGQVLDIIAAGSGVDKIYVHM